MAMEQILLVNPRRRSRHVSASEHAKLSRAARSRPRNALGEFVRKNPRRKSGGRKRAYHHETWSARAHPRNALGEFVRKNPRSMEHVRGYTKRKPGGGMERVRSYSRHYPGYRRNPRGGIFDGIMDDMVKPALGATAGAVAVSLVKGYVPMPAALQSGAGAWAGGVGIALGLGLLARMGGFHRLGDSIGVGGMTIATFDYVKELAATHAPTLKLGGCGYFNPAMVQGPPGVGLFDNSTAPIPMVTARR